jgi:Asp-tRNA(Asn)/Glu-tRNA(Gln) amidotransferase A subunit family amidase
MSDVFFLPAATMAEWIRQKKISPVELVEAHLRRIEQLNPVLNAFSHLDAEGALRQAQQAEEKLAHGAAVGPVHGVPFTIKSSIDVAGLRCEVGTKLRAGHVPQQDAPLVARLRAAGAVVLGTTNTPELLMAYETDNLLHGRTNSPWDAQRTPGGSSGGEAAAIAAGCSAAGVGSDAGGSIRVPAHFSGICGLKATPGRIPATGHFPPSGGPFALLGVVGPMARTVRDLQLMFEVMAGPDDADVCSAPIPLRAVSNAELKGICIGFFEDDGATPVTPETRAAVRRAVRALEEQGFAVAPFLPHGLEEARQAWRVFFLRTAEHIIRGMAAGRESELSPVLRNFLEIAAAEPPLTLERFMSAWSARDAARTRLALQMREFPILICPVCAIPAFRHGERAWTIESRQVGYLHPQRDVMSYAEWFNLTGNPAAVVPVGSSPEGLPIGVQIVGRPHEEELVLAVAEKVESACAGWRFPPLAG